MDKKNSRTDLLAAGRKKLQQYRQKKDGKGSSSQGKSSKRSNKSEQHESDADAASSAAKQTVSSQVPEGETAAVDLSVSQSMESSLPSGLDAAAGVSSVEPIASETSNAEIILASNDGLPIEVVAHGDGDVDSSGPNDGESTRAVDSEPSTEIPSSTADIPVLEGDTKHDNAPDPSTLVDTIEGTVPDMSLSQTRGDPVTDVGAMQEADGLGLNQFDRGNETEFEVDGRLAFSDHERAEHLEGATSEVTSMEGPSREAEQTMCDNASLSILEANSSQTDGSLAESTQMTNKQVEDVESCSPVEDDKEMCSMSGDCGDDKTVKENQQNLLKGPFVSQDESHETSLQRNGELLSDLTLSIPRDGSPVRLSQLVEVIRALNEDEYKLLLNSQEVVSVANVGKDCLAPSCHPDLFEKLREELYLTAFMKDVFYLQLSEQSDLQIESDRHCHQLIDEISVLHSSLNEIQNGNAYLEEELAQCRSELLVFASGREELQNQFHTALSQAEEFSTRANELQSSLVRSQEDLSSLLSELADYKSQVAALQVDNENLNGTLHALTEERKKIVEEKESSLHENENLSMELTRCKDLLVTLQEEIEQLNVTIASLTEEKKIFMDEKLLSLHENEKLQTELADCKAMFASLQVDHSEISKNLALMTEEKMKLEEEKEFLEHEKKKADLGSKVVELTEVQEQLDALQLQHEVEILTLKESLRHAEEALISVRCELQEKISELEQSEQQVSSLTEEKKIFMDEKLLSLHENEKLQTELADCKAMLASLQVDHSDISKNLALMTDEKMKLEEEKEFLEHEKKKANLVFNIHQFGSKVVELTEAQEQLDALQLQHEVEILTLKESLRHAEEALISVRSELQEKISELEQSEHRVSSVREKLSIAVAKGKGLVVQRDGLKQSLVETSAELERCSQELQVKDSQLHELEIKLKAYSEAGERVEALESELSYIRNSATALRESFLLKDSVLQRIEEILEDLDLPEHFHSRDIIEKVDWLARSTTGNALPPNDWDQKSSVGGSHSDVGFVTVDNWKEDAQPSSILGEDLRRKYEDLQSKFYGLAEQNEMLEQSLMERNHLVQRWEELLDRIDMPSQLRSMEPEERIKWLGGALSEANFDRNSLQKKIDNLEDYSGSLSADLEESEKRIYVLEADLQSVTLEREHLSERLESLTSDHHNLVAKAAHLELENEKLQTKVSDLQEEMVKRIEEGERLLKMEGDIERLLDLVGDVLQEQDSEAKDLVSVDGSTACLERLLKKLIENYTNLNSVNPEVVKIGMDQTKLVDPTHDEARSIDVTAQNDVISLKNELEESLQNLMQVKEERDGYFEKLQLLLHEVQALKRKREELQEQLNQEEQKSASVREKLNVAVRKGKSLVQQRDSLKKTVEEMNAELETLKSELRHRENVLADYELKIRDFSAYPERIEALEADNLFLRNHLTETECVLEEKGYILGRVLNTVANIDVGDEIDTSDPVERLERIEKACHDLHAAVASAEQESRKSKRAAELLVAELNEVQERNDNLQEDVAKLASELTGVMKERDVAEAAKLEVLSRLEKLSTVHSERNRNQYSELMMLQSSVIELRKGFHDIHNLLSDASLKELEFLQHLEVNVKSYLEGNDAQDVAGLPYITPSNFENKEDFASMDTLSVSNMQDSTDENPIVEVSILIRHHLRDVMAEINALKEKLIVHSKSVHEQCHSVWNVLGILHRDRNYQKESFEAMRRNIIHIESIGKEKDLEILILRRNIASLYEACAKSVLEVENRKAELLGNNLATADFRTDLKPVTLADGGLSFSGDTSFSEEYIKAMGDKLLSTMKDFSSLKAEIAEGSQREMKTTIANLRKELHEKDIQKDQICMELVDQIKSAEAAATNYSRDLQSSKKLVQDLESELEVMREEQKSLQRRLKELQDVQVNAVELQDRVKSLTDLLSSKDQEIEALMQALDEEEVQMEELTKKIEELEEVLQQKNTALENLEASRGKVMKKLSITMSKFDELHNLSEGLLAEIEQLQSQLQDRDAEISFLRQEVTRCTNDVLVASQMSSKQDLNEINEFLTWFEAIISRVGVSDLQFDAKNNQVPEYKELIKKKIISVISELEDLRGVAQSRDELLQAERSKVEELTHREETLKKTLHEKESQLNLLKDVEDVGPAASFNTEIVEVEPVINKWAVAGTSTKSQVRSLRKVNNDQVAIAIDADDGSHSRLEDEDEDKVHGFKSLTTSRVVPRFTRPISDMIDGLWVSCDRALMRQPALRLGIIIYWALLHTLLAAFVF
ncbi:Prefoldin [Corchorus capsularis]|uniref:Prefoldin n=1 Tax=Corchorus capsularis TaxID=210143 RepID=A0A1R3IFX0_COCAP|nr:Prefoldin [Corchorus capsularis]